LSILGSFFRNMGVAEEIYGYIGEKLDVC